MNHALYSQSSEDIQCYVRGTDWKSTLALYEHS